MVLRKMVDYWRWWYSRIRVSNGLGVGLCCLHSLGCLAGVSEGKILHGQQLLAKSGAAHSTNQAISQGLLEKLLQSRSPWQACEELPNTEQWSQSVAELFGLEHIAC